MLIGKWSFLLLMVFFLAGCKTAPLEILSEQSNEAWWVFEKFKPNQNNLKGIPVKQINPSWERVLLLDEAYLKARLSDSQFKELQQSSLRFSAKVNLDKDPHEETVVVGVYKTIAGEAGRFIAIFRDSKPIKLFAEEGIAGYSSILLESNHIRWYKCMQCNDFDSISWSGADYILH